jgi:hypothetical protein
LVIALARQAVTKCVSGLFSETLLGGATVGSDLGVFEAMANAGKLSAEAEAKNGFELERAIDRAIFRAKERFGPYLANSQSKDDFNERWSEVKPQVIKVIAEVTTPTPGVIRRVGAALRPPVPAQAPVKKDRPSSAKTAATVIAEQSWIKDPAERTAFAEKMGNALVADLQAMAAVRKTAWSYDSGTKLWTSKDPMQKFACPGCGTEQDHLGFTHCAGCDRTWNSWPVRRQSTDKTSASTYVLMAREIKMRGDQFKMASAGNVKVADYNFDKKDDDKDNDDDDDSKKKSDDDKDNDDDDKVKKDSRTKVAGPMMPMPGTMPGDNSGATGAPMAPQQPAVPGGGDTDNDNDVAGGVTEDSPIDQIQDALEGAVMALKDVQMLSINPALAATASTKMAKVATLRTAMDRFWAVHKQWNYVAGMLAKEANEALRTADPRVTGEAEFVRGYYAAAKNQPLPPAEKTGREFLEGYIAFHKQGVDYHDDANVDGLFEPTGKDESTGGNDGSDNHDGAGPMMPANEIRDDAGPFDASQPASQDFARHMDSNNSAGQSRGDQGESSSIQPTGARRSRR